MMTCDWRLIGSRVNYFWRCFDICDFIMQWCWWCCMFTFFMIMHSFILELGRTSVQWWSGSERNYGGLTSREGHSSERNQRHGKISNIPLIPEIWHDMLFEKEMVALIFAFESLFDCVFSVNDVCHNSLLLSECWISPLIFVRCIVTPILLLWCLYSSGVHTIRYKSSHLS